MCLGIPAKIVKINKNNQEAEVSIGNLIKKINIMLIDDEQLAVGDYVILHAGFAIQRLDEEAAKQTLELLSQINEVDR